MLSSRVIFALMVSNPYPRIVKCYVHREIAELASYRLKEASEIGTKVTIEPVELVNLVDEI